MNEFNTTIPAPLVISETPNSGLSISPAILFETVSDAHRKHPNSTIYFPQRGTAHAMAYDFYSPEAFVLAPGESRMVWTDIKAHMPNFVGLILNVRSSMGKYHVSLANTQGWIDADYYGNPDNDGNIGIMLVNNGYRDFHVAEGDRIAQGAFVPFFVGCDLPVSLQRKGGFGSTGK